MPPQVQPLQPPSSDPVIERLVRAILAQRAQHEVQPMDFRPEPGQGPADLMQKGNEQRRWDFANISTPHGQHFQDATAPQGLAWLQENGPQNEAHRAASSSVFQDMANPAGMATVGGVDDWRQLNALRHADDHPLGNLLPGHDFAHVGYGGDIDASVHYPAPGEAVHESKTMGQPTPQYWSQHPDWSAAHAGPTWGNPNADNPRVQALNRSDALASGKAADYGAVFPHPQGPQNPLADLAPSPLAQRRLQSMTPTQGPHVDMPPAPLPQPITIQPQASGIVTHPLGFAGQVQEQGLLPTLGQHFMTGAENAVLGVPPVLNSASNFMFGPPPTVQPNAVPR